MARTIKARSLGVADSTSRFFNANKPGFAGTKEALAKMGYTSVTQDPVYKDLRARTQAAQKQTAENTRMSAQVAEQNEKLRAQAEKVSRDTAAMKEHTDSRINMAKKKYGRKYKLAERKVSGRSLSDISRMFQTLRA